MQELILISAGIFIGAFYFGHLYLQLQNLKKLKRSFFFSFPVRFVFLNISLGTIFYSVGVMGIYSAFGLLAVRLGISIIGYARV